MQGEYEKILAIRKDKYTNLKDIKKLLAKTNRKYQELRKNLPNVRNIISYTEKELSELEEQIKMLKIDSNKVTVDIVVDKEVKGKLEKSNKGLREELSRSKNKRAKLKKAPVVKLETKSKLTRLDRIKNNLNVIESKLKDI